MIARNPYTIKTSYVSAVSGEIDSGTLASTTYNIGYYDDTKVWKAIDEIEEQVDGIESSMATKQWVEEQDYVTSGEITAMSYITMDDVSACGYITEHQSLDGYATEEWVDEQGFITEVPSEFVTETELSNCAYVTALTDSQMNELFPIEQ